MLKDESAQVNDIRRMIHDGRFAEAKEAASSLLGEEGSVAPVLLAHNSVERFEVLADADECLAAIAFLAADYRKVVAHSQQCIVRSQRFRAGAQLLSAYAQQKLDQGDLAAAKMRIISEQCPDMAISVLARFLLADRGQPPD